MNLWQNTQATSGYNCGSVFRNPPGDFAARLIGSCGLKGFSIGGAMVSQKHANLLSIIKIQRPPLILKR